MRALLVEDADELIEPGLLLQEVLRGRLGGFLLERQMHALMATVLLRMPRLDALDVDPQAQPPHREARQAKQGIGAGKGSTVVSADRPGKPKFLENPLKDGKGERRLGVGERFTADQIPRGEVGDGQRITVATVCELELPLVTTGRR